MSDELKIAIEAAKIGAKHALKYFDTNLEVAFKEDKTPVTKADIESENAIRKHITKTFPNAKFVGEEGGGDKSADEFWTIDPVDGTRSFSRGIPGWCVLISLYKNGKFQLGVCYFPVHNELMYTEYGKGAFLNGKKIHVSNIQKLSDALVAVGNPKYIKNDKIVWKLLESSASLRSWESTYSLFLVAQGKAEVLVDGYRLIWDNGPFAVIIPEAGGKITTLDGEDIGLTKRGCIATNGILHDEVVKLYNS